MRRIVVSPQRSGLNWFRFCFEHFYGRRTPGRQSILNADEESECAFIRTHDALNLSRYSRAGGNAWVKFDPAATTEDIVILFLRDPLESFVRMADKDFNRFLSYVGNIRFYVRARSESKQIFYYNDLVSSPGTMCSAMAALRLEPKGQKRQPSGEDVAAEWEVLRKRSIANYDIKQSASGGAQTKKKIDDFKFHQKSLSSLEKSRVWEFLVRKLKEEELMILEPYFPNAEFPQYSFFDRIKLWMCVG